MAQASVPPAILTKIQEAKTQQSTTLDLSCDWEQPTPQLAQVPLEILELTQLEQLNLTGKLNCQT